MHANNIIRALAEVVVFGLTLAEDLQKTMMK